MRWAWDLMSDGNQLAGSGYDYTSRLAATVAAIDALYAEFRKSGPPECENHYVMLVTEERDEHDEPMEMEALYDVGVPYIVRDNGGETADRYSVFFTDMSVLGLSAYPSSPQGVSMWGDYNGNPASDDYEHVGKVIAWTDLPESIRAHVLSRMEEAVEHLRDELKAEQERDETEAEQEARALSGLIGSRARLQTRYDSFEEFEGFSETYGIAARLGFDDAESAWAANPLIESSVEPSDLRVVPELRCSAGCTEEDHALAGAIRGDTHARFRYHFPGLERTVLTDSHGEPIDATEAERIMCEAWPLMPECIICDAHAEEVTP